MPKIKNKFIIFIIVLFTWVILTAISKSFFYKNIDTNSYVLLLNWQALLNNNLLKLNDKQELSIWDTVRTVWKDALAVLEWWDGSVTRLWWDSSVKIDNLYVSDDIWKINIWFELLSWKSWSNVVSFLWEDSYFKEYFRDSEAAVRWTIFNVDLNNDYLNVTDHKVKFTNSWRSIIINENKPFSLKTFDFIALEEYIKNLKDSTWEKINTKIDMELFAWLKEQLNTDFNNLVKFKDIDINSIINDTERREELYNKLLTDYQKLNFIKSEDSDLFKTKLELKEVLFKLSSEENKDELVQNTLYDFKDVISKKEYSNLGNIMTILSENKGILWDIDFNEYFKWGVIPEELKNSLKDNLEGLKNIFWNSFSGWIDIGIDFKDIKNKWDSIIKEALDNWVEKVDNLINK